MADYQVTVSTSYLDDAGTCDHVFIKLVGKDGESKRTRLMDSKGESSFIRGAVSTFTMSCPASIGKLVLIELEKQPSQNPDKWFPTKVEVKSPEGDTFKFLICRWITDSEVYRFREGIVTVNTFSADIGYLYSRPTRILLFSRVKMADYQVTVSTSYLDDAGTCDHVFIKLVGKDGESKRTRLMDSKGESSFIRGAVSTFTMSCPASIGKLVLIELEKQPSQNPDKWFPTKVEVKSPEGDTFKFLICRWITDSEVYRFREGIGVCHSPARIGDFDLCSFLIGCRQGRSGF
uniref:uncharacterized protein LOC117271170 n=1 Tax=Epinephelus lanceolatus TaxID=310571 RepID=UPI0014461791|nr:uncharacterized protein LOC117271170 [Epinephelus lanceolatus]